jgi:maleate cis-trans isomerase
MALRSPETAISTHTPYIIEILKLNAAFKDRNSFEMIAMLTNDDFDNSKSTLAKHQQDPYILRNITFMKIQDHKVYCLSIVDFRNNIRLSVLENNIQTDEIGTQMLEYFHQNYDLRYDGINPPTFNLK